MPKKKTAATKQKKLPRIKPINNFALLMVLSVFQLLSGTAAAGGTGTFEVKVLLCTLALIVLEWLYVSVFYFAMHRRNFELEFIAFFLSGVGITVIGSIKPDDAFKQLLMLIAGVIGFIVLVFLMGDVDLYFAADRQHCHCQGDPRRPQLDYHIRCDFPALGICKGCLYLCRRCHAGKNSDL